MSLNLDDWLKPTDEGAEVAPSTVGVADDEDPITNSLSVADLQLPDLGLPDIKWWVDLEFLDLASGPPANINSGQDKNKNKHNPTLGNCFPDIFFDTTGQGPSSLFGSANDDTHRSLIGDHAFENFEKGLLADLFPSTSTGNEDKLLEDFAEINTNTESVVPPGPVELSKEEESVKDDIVDSVKPVDDEPYSVPLDVLHSISKNFENLQSDFDKSTVSTNITDESRVVRIKSIRKIPPEADIEDVKTPAGTVATIAIQTNKANNTTTFTILPRLGQNPKQSFLVKTHNLSEATKLIRPLHLDRLPVFKNLFTNVKDVSVHSTNSLSIKVKTTNRKESSKENPEKRAPSKDINNMVNELKNELKTYNVHYDTIDVKQNLEGKLEWFCPEENCVRTFVKKSQLKLHIFSHKSVKPFRCSKEGCQWSFPTIVRLKRHEQSHEGLKLFKCNLPGCEDRSFTTIYNLNTHIKDHAAKDDQFKCNLCEDALKSQRLLDLHMKNSHSKEYVPSYSCLYPGCLQVYFTQADLSRHGLSHDPSKKKESLVCYVCQKSFKIKSQLISHERIHNGQRPFVCLHPGCQWSFRTSSKLKRHERSHKNERSYVCEQCPKSYLRSEHLREHVEVVHKNQRLACPYSNCEARFSQKHSLVVHVKKHQDDPQALDQSKYRCVIEKCGQKFQSKRNLSQHVKHQHQPELDVTTSTEVVQDQSELDLMALLSCVADEDLKVTVNSEQNQEKSGEELITVDASAITPIKEPPNIISKGRKRKSGYSSEKTVKKCNREINSSVNSTINMQDLV